MTAIELTRDTRARQRRVRDQRQALAREVVDDGEHAEAAPIAKASDTKSSDQRWFGPPRHRHRRPRSERPLAPATLANHELLLAVDAVELLVVHERALAPQQQVQTPVAEPAACRRQRPSSAREAHHRYSPRADSGRPSAPARPARQARRCE